MHSSNGNHRMVAFEGVPASSAGHFALANLPHSPPPHAQVRPAFQDALRVLEREYEVVCYENQRLREQAKEVGSAELATVSDIGTASWTVWRDTTPDHLDEAKASSHFDTHRTVISEDLVIGVGAATRSSDVTIGENPFGMSPKKRDAFVLKRSWKELPEASGMWGQDLEESMDRMRAEKAREREEDGQRNESAQDRGGYLDHRSRSLSTVSRATLRPSRQEESVRCVLRPGSFVRMFWDLIGLGFISYDLITIPVDIAFEPDDTTFFVAVRYITLFFWTFDMLVSPNTGYFERDGTEVLERRKIVMKYLRTWFLIDILVVVPDWVLTLMHGNRSGDENTGNNASRLGRVVRIARTLRVLRLLRLLKLKKLIDLVYDMIDSEYMFIVVNLIQLLTFILVLNHLVACAWFLVGRMSEERGSNTGLNWLESVGLSPVAKADVAWQYTTALHWSITQFTPASMDIYATNLAERVFSVAILFWALVALSSVIGSVSSSMTALRNVRGDEMRAFWLLRRYLRQKQIPSATTTRVIKYLEHKSEQARNTVSPAKVTLLVQISEQLQLELTKEMSAPVLIKHNFFAYLHADIPIMMFRVCHLALKGVAFATDDVAFDQGEEARITFFVKSGQFVYEIDDRELNDSCMVEHVARDGSTVRFMFGQQSTWVSEPALWTSWRHWGIFKAAKPGELLKLHPEPFAEVLRSHPRPFYYAKIYASDFVKLLNGMEKSELSDVLIVPELARFARNANQVSRVHIEKQRKQLTAK